MNSKSPTWAVHGFTDVKNIDRATKRHDKCQDHVGAAIRLSLLGTMPIDQGPYSQRILGLKVAPNRRI